ncbi:sulfatase-like hydrolase/transferase [Panacibacter ginsenosidivorans]|nr:sulfatase-like hydrolase/transferase [Panacibacter ginsenosidivorans]
MKTKLFFLPVIMFLLCVGVMVLQSCRKASELSPLEDKTLTAADASQAASNGKPNIILILADDVGYGIPTVDGGESFQTPNIDKLANAGMRFTNCYGSPLCSPSRTMFMTGKYNFRNYSEWGVLDLNQKMMSNVLQGAGYATYVAAKWEFDGGDASIRAHGFDGYSVWNAFVGDNGSHYKTPRIYENGTYLPDNLVANLYGDDIFTDRVISFVKQNKNNNFFVYFPITLCHYPYSPTPDDPEFATWDNKTSTPDTAYFPSMVKYMDKKIGQLMDSLRAWNLFNNTIVMFVGDNGTPHNIWFTQDGVYQEGAKSTTTILGTHVPLIVSWPAGGVTGGQVNNNLIDFTDFMPTAIEAAGATVPADYGQTDGLSFLNQLKGFSTPKRDWIFCHYKPGTNQPNGDKVRRWINNTTYKLYDSTGKFYNIVLDPKEKNPIKKSAMTPQEKAIRQQFQATMDTLH